MSSISPVTTGFSAQQVTNVVQQQLQSSQSNGQPNLFQVIDKLDISSRAKTMVENSMAQQLLTNGQATPSAPQGTSGATTTAVAGSQASDAFASALATLRQGRHDMKSALQEIKSGQSQGQTDLTHAIQELRKGHHAMHSLLGVAGSDPTEQAQSTTAQATPATTDVSALLSMLQSASQTDPLLSALQGSSSSSQTDPLLSALQGSSTSSQTDPLLRMLQGSSASGQTDPLLSALQSINASSQSNQLSAYFASMLGSQGTNLAALGQGTATGGTNIYA